MAESSKEDVQLPLRFIIPTTTSPASSRDSLSCSEPMVSFNTLKGVFKLQSVLMDRFRCRYCLCVWRKSAAKACYSHWSLLTPKPHAGTLSRQTDFNVDILTEASTPAGISEPGPKDFTRQRTLDCASTQTDPAMQPEGLQDLRKRLFPMLEDRADFWEQVVDAAFEGKAERMRAYEAGVREIGMFESAVSQAVARIEAIIGGFSTNVSQTGGISLKSECVKTLISVKDWIYAQEEKLGGRRRELEDIHCSLQARARIHQLESRCESLLYPHILDLRTEHAHTILEKQALELEKRTLELREEELVTQIELNQLRIPPFQPVCRRKTPLASAVGHWTLFSLLNQPALPLAWVLFRLKSRNKEGNRKKKRILGRILRNFQLKARDIQRKYLYSLQVKSLSQHFRLLQPSDCSPSLSYLSIAEECSVRSVKGLFSLKSMDFISDSNRNSALIRLNSLANRIKSKGIAQKQAYLLRWTLYSQTVEVKYYRALIRSVDSILQSIRRGEDAISQENRQIQGKMQAKMAQIALLLERIVNL